MSKETQKGSTFERQVADYIAERTGLPVDRRVKCGRFDKGDIAGFRFAGRDFAVECKNHRRIELSEWLGEAEAERVNAGAAFAAVIHKRRGCGDKRIGETYVTMTLDTLLDMVQVVRNG